MGSHCSKPKFCPCTTFPSESKICKGQGQDPLKNFKLKIREEEKASGIEVEELSELDLALEEIIEKEKAANAQLDLDESVRKNELQDKANAEEMRLQAMEKLGESKKRKEASGLTAGDQKKKKARRSGSDTLDFMREKMEKDMTMKQEEMAQRRSEQQKMLEQQNNVLQQMQLQQVNQRQQMQDMLSAFMQHSQLKSQTMLAIVEKFTEKD